MILQFKYNIKNRITPRCYPLNLIQNELVGKMFNRAGLHRIDLVHDFADVLIVHDVQVVIKLVKNSLLEVLDKQCLHVGRGVGSNHLTILRDVAERLPVVVRNGRVKFLKHLSHLLEDFQMLTILGLVDAVGGELSSIVLHISVQRSENRRISDDVVELQETDGLGLRPNHMNTVFNEEIFLNLCHLFNIVLVANHSVRVHHLLGKLENVGTDLFGIFAVGISTNHIDKVLRSKELAVLVAKETIDTNVLLGTLDAQVVLEKPSLKFLCFLGGERFNTSTGVSLHIKFLVESGDDAVAIEFLLINLHSLPRWVDCYCCF